MSYETMSDEELAKELRSTAKIYDAEYGEFPDLMREAAGRLDALKARREEIERAGNGEARLIRDLNRYMQIIKLAADLEETGDPRIEVETAAEAHRQVAEDIGAILADAYPFEGEV